ncbi:hypothetical protein CCACVL1_01921 [Corchorus capsularis]|uniref:Uncharacterized protein n=1 Tax=Corchorus capsularis TaxID=210143 RepID=A0A1R3KEE7_COCAP|nr:hypothetical protein CCACVL1_01921 [Corchorus capsularis]
MKGCPFVSAGRRSSPNFGAGRTTPPPKQPSPPPTSPPSMGTFQTFTNRLAKLGGMMSGLEYSLILFGAGYTGYLYGPQVVWEDLTRRVDRRRVSTDTTLVLQLGNNNADLIRQMLVKADQQWGKMDERMTKIEEEQSKQAQKMEEWMTKMEEESKKRKGVFC